MKRTNRKANLIMTGLIAALVLMLWLQRSPNGMMPEVSAQAASHNVGHVLPVLPLTGYLGDSNLDGVRGRVVYSGASWSTGDWNGDGEFNILSFKHGLSISPAGGAPEFQQFVITKGVDKSTPKLERLIAEGMIIPSLEIHLTASYITADQKTILKYQLENVMVTSYNVKGSTQGGEPPVEEVGFIFDKISVIHTEYDENGQSKGDTEFTFPLP